MKSSRRRSTRQIRKSLHETRKRLDHDLAELQDSVEESVSPRNILSRHPALMTAAGAVIGLLVIRNPAMIGRALTRLAQASAPFLVRAVLQKGGSAVAHMAWPLSWAIKPRASKRSVKGSGCPPTSSLVDREATPQ